MYSHITLGTNDLERSRQFYKAVLPHVDLPTLHDFSEDGMIGFSEEGAEHCAFFICKPLNGNAATVGNGSTTAFLVKERGKVDAFYAAVIAEGGKDEGPPGLRLHYAPDYYATYVRDLDGHKLCCVCRN